MTTEVDLTKQLTEKGYQQTSYEQIDTTPNLTLPIADSAKYKIMDSTQPEKIKSQLESDGYELIAPVISQSFFSTKAQPTNTDTFFYIKINEGRIYIFPHDDKFNRHILKNVIESISTVTTLSHYTATN